MRAAECARAHVTVYSRMHAPIGHVHTRMRARRGVCRYDHATLTLSSGAVRVANYNGKIVMSTLRVLFRLRDAVRAVLPAVAFPFIVLQVRARVARGGAHSLGCTGERVCVSTRRRARGWARGMPPVA